MEENQTVFNKDDGTFISHQKVVIKQPIPEDMAECFWTWNSGQQARFLNQLGSICDDSVVDFAMQLEAITSDPKLNNSGRKVMRLIGEFSERLIIQNQ